MTAYLENAFSHHCLHVPYFRGTEHADRKRAGWKQGTHKVDRRFKESPCVEKTLLFWQL